MTWGAILGLTAAAIVTAAFGVILLFAWLGARMEQYQSDLEGVEIEGGELHDLPFDPQALSQAEAEARGLI